MKLTETKEKRGLFKTKKSVFTAVEGPVKKLYAYKALFCFQYVLCKNWYWTEIKGLPDLHS